MVPKLMLDGMPYDLSEITPNTLEGDTSWNGDDSAEIMLFKLQELGDAIVGQVPNNGYWISFVEIMDSNGDWFVPTIQYAFHVFIDRPYNDKIYNMLKIKNTYVRNTQGDNKWKLVNRTHGNPIPEADMVRRGATGEYKSRLSEGSYIWVPVDMGTPGVNYVVSSWTDISSFAFRELLLRDIDPEVGELKMLIQVAADMNKFQAAINRTAI